jgi:hypothetical protein
MARSRKERREVQREAVKDARRRLSVAARARGGAPDLPVVVESASVIEPIASSTPCVACGEHVRVIDHEAKTIAGNAVREVTVKCVMCGVARKVYFAIQAPN